jgi:two-component system, LytTR family, response regulator
VMKPVKPERLQKAVEKVTEALANKPRRERGGDLKPDSQVFIKDGEKCFFVKLSDIFMFESAGNYVKVHFGTKAPLLHKSLNLLETKLPEDMFFRANRKEMINLAYIQNIESYFKGGLHVTLKSGHNVEVSTRQAVRFKEFLSL